MPESFKLNVYWEDQLKGHAWLPRSIDSETPERGLQGMIKNFEFLSDNSSHWVCSFWTEISPTAEEKWSEGATPTEALLRALKEQKEKG